MYKVLVSLSRICLSFLFVAAALSARADNAGDLLLQKCTNAMTSATSIEAEFVSTSGPDKETKEMHGTFRLKKPNYARIVLHGSTADDNVSIYSDGRRVTMYRRDDNKYVRDVSDMSGGNISRDSPEISIFFYPDLLNRYAFMGSGVKVVGTAQVGGVACKLAQISANGTRYTLKIGTDGLLRGLSIVGKRDGNRWTYDSRLTNVKANVPLPAATFAFTMPKGAKPYGGAVFQASTGKMEQSELLPIGSTAPDFTLPDTHGEKLVFSSVVKANKVTLLNFWSYF